MTLHTDEQAQGYSPPTVPAGSPDFDTQDLGVTKIPSSNKIQKRIENLESEQAATVREKQELQKKQKTLDIIQQNFIALMYTPNVKSDSLQTKRESVPISRDE